ncbi:glycosyltransferase family 2 protein [Okibacterium endophyticum]
MGVVTVTHNSVVELETFLRSVRINDAFETEVVVADNQSDDWDQIVEVSRRFEASPIQLGRNAGYGAAANAGVKRLSHECDFILVSNPDVSLHRGAIKELVEYAVSDPAAGAVGPKIVDQAGEVYPSARRQPSLFVGAAHALFVSAWPTNPWTKRYHNHSDDSSPREVEWLSGACLLLRRQSFESVNGFDEAFFMYFEDVDLGYRLGESGWRSVYDPTAVVTHTGAHSTAKQSELMTKVHHSSAYLYLAKRYPHWYHMPLRAVLKLGLKIRSKRNDRAVHG